MNSIKNIILDLGGVLLNLSWEKTYKAFEDLGLKNFETLVSQFSATPLFEDLETGKVGAAEFLAGLKQQTGLQAEDAEIIHAWNAMLLDFPPERIEWLKALPKKYRVFLFSNTNILHHDAFQQTYRENFQGHAFNDHFEKAYYSHEFGKRKPYVESYLDLLQDAGISAHETLFIDDTSINIEGAKAAGLQAIHLNGGKTVLDLEGV